MNITVFRCLTQSNKTLRDYYQHGYVKHHKVKSSLVNIIMEMNLSALKFRTSFPNIFPRQKKQSYLDIH